MDSANGSALERPAATIRAVPNRAPAIPKLGALRRDGKPAAHAGATSPGRWRFGFERMFCGRDLCAGQKRGRLVGKTKRGKGTKIMGIADGHGLSLAFRTESASPAAGKMGTATPDPPLVTDGPLP